ncbi:DoxX family protein [Salisaeta longa]|uniref:DoxX family protein n=1 Tax=Salisaeta longa TaxID=503170 RepID=UPI0003B3C90A|nr:DoxX family protein [Salisaeta longa]
MTDVKRWASVDTAVLVLRIGIGISFVFVYGAAKIFGGPEQWAGLGQKMRVLGITVWPTVWGFLGAASEFVGGLLLMLGLFFRPALAFLCATMLVAAAGHISGAIDGGPWHATEMLTVFIALLLTGPGRYSLDHWWAARSRPTTAVNDP